MFTQLNDFDRKSSVKFNDFLPQYTWILTQMEYH